MSVEKSTARVTKLTKAPSQYYSPQQTKPNTDHASTTSDNGAERPSIVEWVREEARLPETDVKKIFGKDHSEENRFSDKLRERLRLSGVLTACKAGCVSLARNIREWSCRGAKGGAVFVAVHAKKVVASSVAALILIGVSAAAVSSTCSLACRIKLGDKEIGNLPSEQVYYEILSDVKEEVLDTADVDFEPSGELSVNRVLIGKGQYTDPEDVKRRLKATSNEMIPAWSVSIDGKTVLALNGQEDALSLLEEYRQQFAEENAALSFRSKVEIAKEFVPIQLVRSKEDALAYLNSEDAPELLVQSALTVERDEEIPFEIEQQTDDTKYIDEITVIQEGQTGTKHVKYFSVKVNGVETEHTVLEETVLSQPIPKIELVGTKERPSPVGSGTFAQPVSGTLTSNFGRRWNRAHQGIDIGASTGTTIYAADNGTVIYSAFNSGGYGNMIQIDHGNGFVTYYAHCSELLAQQGAVVAKGDPIAKVGSTGRSTGPHLHFEVRKNGEPQNPLDYVG